MTASPATWRARHCISIIIKGRATVGRLDERALPGEAKGGVERIKAGGRINSVERRAAEEVELVKT